MKVSNVFQMQKLDQTAIETYGIVDELLMENAGLAVFEVIRERVGVHGKCFLVFSGAGNNGGDGFVVARKIHAGGGEVKVYLLGNPEKYRGAAKLNWEIINRMPIEIQPFESVSRSHPAYRVVMPWWTRFSAQALPGRLAVNMPKRSI